MKISIKYIAQSGFLIDMDGIKMIIDPWIDNPIKPLDRSEVEGVEYVFLTHAHSDHGPDQAVNISEDQNAYLISPYDFAREVSGEKVVSANVGGFFQVGDIEVKYMHATHTSDVGLPVGYMIKVDDKIIYHMGDTGYQSDFKVFGDLYDIDVLFVPIGSVYTMDPYEAAVATVDFGARFVVPMHYNTFPKIEQDSGQFTEMVKKRSGDIEVLALEPGDKSELEL